MEYKYIDESNALIHYGVLGMKWGVRKDGSSNIYRRNIMDDYQRGQAARRRTMNENRRAIAKYKRQKTASNAMNVAKTTAKRAAFNVAAPALGIDSLSGTRRGRYERYRQAGSSRGAAALKTYAATYGLTIGALSNPVSAVKATAYTGKNYVDNVLPDIDKRLDSKKYI